MPYTIAGKTYRTKKDVTARCQAILYATPVGGMVDMDDAAFLLGLFSHHTEWTQKHGPGISAITTQFNGHETKGFWLIRVDGESIDISFMHAIKHLPTARKADLTPQPLIDFKRGAREAIKDQIDEFRSKTVFSTQDGMHVDHAYPRTFDALLFGFCLENGINPLTVEVVEREGCLHHIIDDEIRDSWWAYHRHYAELRLLSSVDNLKAKKARIDWSKTWDKAGARESERMADAYTRTCPVCGNVFQTDEHDDPDGGAVWYRWEGPCCIAIGEKA